MAVLCSPVFSTWKTGLLLAWIFVLIIYTLSPLSGASTSLRNAFEKHYDLKAPLSGPDSGSLRPLILFVYAESKTARPNLEFFVRNALHDNADFIFVFNGPTNMTEIVPQNMPNVRIIERENKCFDLGGIGEVLRKDDLWKRYRRFITVNASVRGPFMPVWSDRCWSDMFLDRITDKVKLAGLTVNCGPLPHIQSMILTTDEIGMGLLLDPNNAHVGSVDDNWGSKEDVVGLTGCYENHMKAIHAEIGTSRMIIEKGYELDAMMTSYSSVKPIDKYCKTFEGDTQYKDRYFGINLHPYETIFYKTNRDMDPLPVEKLTEWQNNRNYDSRKACRASHYI